MSTAPAWLLNKIVSPEKNADPETESPETIHFEAPTTFTEAAKKPVFDSDAIKLMEKSAGTALGSDAKVEKVEVPPTEELMKAATGGALDISSTNDEEITCVEHENSIDSEKSSASNRFLKKFLPNTEFDLSHLRDWVSSFKNSPEVVKSIVQSYAAVLVAREKRFAEVHGNLCNVKIETDKTANMLKIVKEKCRTEVVKEYVKEKFETQRAYFKECQEIVSKKLEHEKALEQIKNSGNQGLIAFAMVCFILSGRVTKRQVMILAIAFQIWKHFELVKKHVGIHMEKPIQMARNKLGDMAKNAIAGPQATVEEVKEEKEEEKKEA